MPRHMRACAARGFTLVELVVAIAVFAILAVMAVPAFTTWREKAALRGEADAVIALIADARTAAVKQGLGTSVRFVGEGAQWCVGAREGVVPIAGMPLITGGACDCAGDAEACVVDGRRAMVRGDRAVLLAPVEAMAFDGVHGMRIGQAPASLRLAARDGRHALTITLSPMGHAALCSTGGPMLGVPSC